MTTPLPDTQPAVETPQEKAMACLIGIGICAGFIFLSLEVAMLTTAHQAIRIERGESDSWWFAISMVFINPIVIGLVASSATAFLKKYLSIREGR